MTGHQDTVEEPERSADERDENTSGDERTSPSPYAEDFSEWVAEETAPPERGDSLSDAEQAKVNEDRALEEGRESPG